MNHLIQFRKLIAENPVQGETQEISKLLSTLSSQQSDLSPQTLHKLYFAILLLNTDLHCIQSPSHRKMTREQFIRNTAIAHLNLGEVYDSILNLPLNTLLYSPSMQAKTLPSSKWKSVKCTLTRTGLTILNFHNNNFNRTQKLYSEALEWVLEQQTSCIYSFYA